MQYALSMPQLNKMEMTDSFVIVRTVKSPWIFHQIEMRREKKIPFRQRGFPKLPKLDNGFTTFSFLAKNVKFAQFILYIYFYY